ncbi:hypothetical protein ACWD5Q_26600 [Streptomyces sp. NPDC002513]
MSTVIDKAPVVAAPVRTGRHSAAAVLALARFEARELLVQILGAGRRPCPGVRGR